MDFFEKVFLLLRRVVFVRKHYGSDGAGGGEMVNIEKEEKVKE